MKNMKNMKTYIYNKESEKRTYIPPVLDCIKLDNEISLILATNNFTPLPGDPFAPGCSVYEEVQSSESPWE